MRLGLATLCAVVLLALPATAAASSIVMVRDGDVWISTPDGTFERRLTTGGGYGAPSMADDGTIVALRGGRFVRLRADGAPIGSPVQAVGGDWVVEAGPFDARVSPDGSKIAYWFTGRRRLCPLTEPGCFLRGSPVIAYAVAGRVTDPVELGIVHDRREPSWYGSARALAFRYGQGTGETVAIDRLGDGDSPPQGWFSYDDGTQLGQGQLSHAADRLAAVAGGNEIHLFGITAPPPALPALRCIVPGTGLRSPTWSPDGSMLAWAAPDGVHVAGPVPDLAASAPDCSAIRERRLAAGSDPYWGPADVPGAPAAAPFAGTAPAASPAPRAFRELRVARRQRGPVVRLRLRISRGPARVDVRLTRRGRPAGRRVLRGVHAGVLRLRVPLDRSARRALARRGRLALRVRVGATAPGRAPASARRRVTVKAV